MKGYLSETGAMRMEEAWRLFKDTSCFTINNNALRKGGERAGIKCTEGLDQEISRVVKEEEDVFEHLANTARLIPPISFSCGWSG